jgi:hypothetical protein
MAVIRLRHKFRWAGVRSAARWPQPRPWAGLARSGGARPARGHDGRCRQRHAGRAGFDGIGAIIGGGGNTRLLTDYPRAQRSRILGYLFRPDYAADLQILNVEIGGDTNSTSKSELPAAMAGSWPGGFSLRSGLAIQSMAGRLDTCWHSPAIVSA